LESKNKSSSSQRRKLKDLIYDFFDISTTTLMKRCFSMSGHGVSDVDEDTYLASYDIDDPDTLPTEEVL
jgi:hypothetical protein